MNQGDTPDEIIQWLIDNDVNEHQMCDNMELRPSSMEVPKLLPTLVQKQ